MIIVLHFPSDVSNIGVFFFLYEIFNLQEKGIYTKVNFYRKRNKKIKFKFK